MAIWFKTLEMDYYDQNVCYVIKICANLGSLDLSGPTVHPINAETKMGISSTNSNVVVWSDDVVVNL